jgi:transposase-like protein
MNKLCCPQCRLSHIKRNGLTHYGKQNYRCFYVGDRSAPALENCGASFRKFTGTTQLSIRMAWQPIKRCYSQRGIKSAPRVRVIRTSYFICSYNKEVIGFAEPALHL